MITQCAHQSNGSKRETAMKSVFTINEINIIKEKTISDYLKENLDLLFVGINPGFQSAYTGHHYANPCNHFWRCLYLASIIDQPLTANDDHTLLEKNIGFTNIVARATRSASELTRAEIIEGGKILTEKIQRFQPKIAVFNGIGIYEIYSGKKNCSLGLQEDCIEGTKTYIFVMPSSSPRCARFPRLEDKLKFYHALKKFSDYLKDKATLTAVTTVSKTSSSSLSSTFDYEQVTFPPVNEMKIVSKYFTKNTVNECNKNSIQFKKLKIMKKVGEEERKCDDVNDNDDDYDYES